MSSCHSIDAFIFLGMFSPDHHLAPKPGPIPGLDSGHTLVTGKHLPEYLCLGGVTWSYMVQKKLWGWISPWSVSHFRSSSQGRPTCPHQPVLMDGNNTINAFMDITNSNATPEIKGILYQSGCISKGQLKHQQIGRHVFRQCHVSIVFQQYDTLVNDSVFHKITLRGI